MTDKFGCARSRTPTLLAKSFGPTALVAYAKACIEKAEPDLFGFQLNKRVFASHSSDSVFAPSADRL